MKKIVLTSFFALIAVVAIFAVIISMQPDEYSVERTTTIDAPADVVFAQVNDFRNWEAWSPWAQDNPDMETDFSGAERGEGAVFSWEGYSEAGAGQMTILQSRAHEYIEIELQFFEPFVSTSTTTFDFVDLGDGTTEVTWGMSGENNFLSKAIGLFMDMDEMIGDDYERGLTLLDRAAQDAIDEPKSDSETTPP